MNQIQETLMRISIPYIFVISAVGLGGNTLTIIMLSKRPLTKNFNNCTLIALALTDLIFNLALISRCFSDMIETYSDDFCRLLSFVSHLAELLSAGFTVHFTIQRFIAVKFPLSAFIEKNFHLLHYLIVTSMIIFGTGYCVALVLKNEYESCQEELRLSWFISDALSSFVIPFTLIAILNFSISIQLKKTYRVTQPWQLHSVQQTEALVSKQKRIQTTRQSRQTVTCENQSNSRLTESIVMLPMRTSNNQIVTLGEASSSTTQSIDPNFSSDTSCHRPNPVRRSTTRFHTQSHHVTRMLILVSTCFLLLNAPAHISTISLKIYAMTSSPFLIQINNTAKNLTDLFDQNINSSISIKTEDAPSNFKVFQFLYILTIVTHHIAYASYSINFFLYSLCGVKFRQELVRMFLKIFRQFHRKNNAQHFA